MPAPGTPTKPQPRAGACGRSTARISTFFYERLLGSQDKAGVNAEAIALIIRDAPADPRDFIRDPYALEFLGAQPDAGLYEQDLEPGLLDQLQKFLMELGSVDVSFAFVARQKHLRVEGDNPTLGLILCSERNSAVAKYSLLADNAQLFASKYQWLVPSEDELRIELERDRTLLESARGTAD